MSTNKYLLDQDLLKTIKTGGPRASKTGALRGVFMLGVSLVQTGGPSV